MDKVQIEHFSDVLCVWAYVSQIRLDELITNFGDSIELTYHYIDVFGDCRTRIEEQWRERGGFAGYGEHVRSVVARFDHVDVHPRVWTENAPQTSMNCHAFLRAVHLSSPEQLPRAAWAVREAFFRDGIDISLRSAQLAIAEALHLDRSAIEQHLACGRAYCGLSADFRLARERSIAVSPTFIFNEGRQRLIGNVGYRVIDANVRELLRNPAGEASWC